MKQKIVIKMSIHCDKCRSKALKMAAGISGVESLTLTGQDKDQVELVGDGIDSVELTRQLRKNVAHAELVSVGEVKKEEKPPAATTASATPPAGGGGGLASAAAAAVWFPSVPLLYSTEGASLRKPLHHDVIQ